jgi:uncharacterized protein (DUF1778 family)
MNNVIKEDPARITFIVESKFKQKIKLAALKKQETMTDFVVDAIKDKLITTKYN